MPLHLEPTDRRHIPAFQRLAAHPEVAATTQIPHPYPPDGAKRFVEDVARPGRAAGTRYAFAMVDGDELVGHVSLKHVDRERGQGEVGYWVGRPYWGRGYASAAVREVVRIAFAELELTRLYAHVLVHNPASARVLEKAGFVAVELGPDEVPCGCAEKGETLGFELRRAAWASNERAPSGS